jgi:membrane peptidoglycan carboxypeptidase
MKAQSIAERYVTAATIVPQLSGAAFDRAIRQYKLGKDRDWISPLRGVGIHNGAMVALDYKTGDVLAYVGSAGYYRDDLASKKFNPKYDVAGVGFRQPGSAFKPVVYTTGFDQRKITAGSVLLDVTTAFASTWTPEDADSQERGPVLARKALQYSLNIPAIRALDRTGFKSVDQAAAKAGLKFQAGTSIEGAGLAGAIGTVEVRLQDLVSTYGAFGNGGVVTEPRMILDVTDSAGNSVATAGDPIQRKVWSPQAAWIMANILEGNTNPRDNLIWGPRFRLDNGPGNAYRPAAIKTGTTNEVRDVSAYGLLPKPTDPDQPAIALGVWMGNSDHRQPTLGDRLIFAADGPGEVWHSFMREYMKGKPVAEFERPKGLVEQTIDAYSGGRPGPWTRDTVSEWFINGTQPGGNDAVDPPGILYTQQCGTWMVDPVKAENRGAPAIWTNADRDWARRAARGPGVAGAYGTRTSYFWGRASWGGPITSGGPCITPPPATPTPRPTPEPTATSPDTTPGPQPTPRRTPRPRPTEPPPVATPTPEPVITPAPTCRPNSNRPPGCIPVEPPPPPAPPADQSPAADAAVATTFGLTVTAASHVSQHHQVPYGITGSIQPAILSEASSSPVRIGRRRRSVRRRR